MRIKNHFPINNIALSLAWKRSHGATRKRPIGQYIYVIACSVDCHFEPVRALELLVLCGIAAWDCFGDASTATCCYMVALETRTTFVPLKLSHSAIQHSVAPLSSATSNFKKDSCTSTWMGSFYLTFFYMTLKLQWKPAIRPPYYCSRSVFLYWW